MNHEPERPEGAPGEPERDYDEFSLEPEPRFSLPNEPWGGEFDDFNDGLMDRVGGGR